MGALKSHYTCPNCGDVTSAHGTCTTCWMQLEQIMREQVALAEETQEPPEWMLEEALEREREDEDPIIYTWPEGR